jgi:AraC family transcriptional regulator
MLGGQECAFAKVERDLALPFARVRIIRYRSDDPIDVLGVASAYRVELALVPRAKKGVACFQDRWGPHRFEPVGEMFLMPPDEPLRARGEGSRQLSLVCEFDQARVSGWFDGEMDWTGRRLEAGLNIVSPTLRATLQRLGDEVQAPGFGGEVMAELVAAQAAVELARTCGALGDGAAAGGLAPWRLRLIEERLAELCAPPSLGELAQLCGVSVRQLTRGFRASRGCSIGDHVARARIEHAKRLLATDAPVKVIAWKLGFNSPSNFSSAFQRAQGESPRLYRERLARTG